MPTMTKVLRWGNSIAIKIPARMVRAVGLVHGSEVELRRERNHLVIVPLDAPPTLEQLLAQVTPANLHPEFERYPARERGLEVR
jgi:antitoxin MazE